MFSRKEKTNMVATLNGTNTPVEEMLEDLGELSWVQAVELTPQPAGLTNRQPTPQMLEEEGYDVEITDSRGKRKFICNYDKNYVAYYAMKCLFKPLGVITPKGQVKKDWLTKVLLPDWIEYAEAETDRNMERVYREKAQAISELNNMPFDICLEFVKTGKIQKA